MYNNTWSCDYVSGSVIPLYLYKIGERRAAIIYRKGKNTEILVDIYYL